jgi:hypothetical protein
MTWWPAAVRTDGPAAGDAGGAGKQDTHDGTPLQWVDGIRRDAGAVIAGHAFVQNVRRGHYELTVEEPVNRKTAAAPDVLLRC